MMRDRIPFGYIFGAGLLAGILIMNFGKSTLLESTGLWGESILKQITAMSLTGGALFVYILSKRGLRFLMLSLLATTYLGIIAGMVMAFWYGFAGGCFLASAVLSHGLKGILLVLAGILPQYLVYGPMMYGLLRWCMKTCCLIYRKGIYINADTKTPVLVERVLKWLLLLAALIAGCALESLVNPPILKAVVRLI